MIEDEHLSVFKEKENNLPKFNPKSDTIIRLELEKMKKEKDQVNQQLTKSKLEYEGLENKRKGLENKRQAASNLFRKNYLFKKYNLIAWFKLIQINIWDYESIKKNMRKFLGIQE